MIDSLKELSNFIQIGARLDLKSVAIGHILGVTGTEQGVKSIVELPEVLVSLISLLQDGNDTIAKDAALCLINISAYESAAATLLNLDVETHCPPLQTPPQDIIRSLLVHIFNPNSKIADPCCMILSNISRPSHLSQKVIDRIEESDKGFDDLINVFTKKQYSKVGAKLHYLGPVLSNLSQSSRVRQYILSKEKCVLQRLLPFTEYQDSIIRRGGVVGTLKNCCFQTDLHEWLLGEEVDILPRLLLPLAGNEEFDDDDNDKLPPELQYLPEDKKREEDPDIRCILLEAITQLCAKKQNRELIRDKNTYVILRELHKWEKDKKAKLACENLVDILIRTEDEIGEDNLIEVEVPNHLQETFEKGDQEFLEG